MPAKRRRYAGELAAPVVRPDPPAFEGAFTPEREGKYQRDVVKHERKAQRLVAKELVRKLGLLMQHYGTTDLMELVFALASAHVPGFKIVPETKVRKGRKRQWDGLRLQALFQSVNVVKSKHNLTEKAALKFMVTAEEYAGVWGPRPNHKGSKTQWIETLESRLQEAKRYVRRVETLQKIGKGTNAAALREMFRKW